MDKPPDPLIYILNRDCMDLNLDLLNYIRNFNLTREDKAKMAPLSIESKEGTVVLGKGNTLADYIKAA